MPRTISSPRQHPLSLRQRLLFALLLPIGAILILSSYLDYRVAVKTTNQAHDQALMDNVFDLEAHIRSHDAEAELDLSEETEAMLRSDLPDLIYFSVTDQNGKLIAGDADLPHFDGKASPHVQLRDGIFQGQTVRMALHGVHLHDQDFRIQVIETTEKRRQASLQILTAMILPNVAVIIVTVLVIVLGVRQGLLPLESVENEIAARSPNDLQEIDLASAPAEIRPLLKRLNELFLQLRLAATVQQRFIGDAAHQLRTPLAGLQNQIDLAAAEGYFASQPARLASIEEATQRIGHLLSQLLSFARAEASTVKNERFETVALATLLENAASVFLDRAVAKNIDLGFEIEPADVPGLPWLLNEAVSNLIDNALHYTPTGGTITVRCGQTEARPFIEVEDSGPGIPEAEHQRVFERFYRMPGSAGDGCGLGLPIVREIMLQHRASIALGTGNLGGLRIRIAFPAVATQPPTAPLPSSEG